LMIEFTKAAVPRRKGLARRFFYALFTDAYFTYTGVLALAPEPPLPPWAPLRLFRGLYPFCLLARSVAPDLLREVTAEEASHLFCSRVSAIEKPAGSEVVKLSVNIELRVGTDGLVGVVL
jgi:hypothetical protein